MKFLLQEKHTGGRQKGDGKIGEGKWTLVKLALKHCMPKTLSF